MDKRNVLVSGGTRGVGLAIARKLAADGYRVFALGRKESDELTKAIAEFAAGAMNFVPFDLANVDAHSRTGARNEGRARPALWPGQQCRAGHRRPAVQHAQFRHRRGW